MADLLVEQSNPDFRSGLCAALGTIPWEQISPAERNSVRRALVELYLRSPDGGTHSAADWSLRQWGQELPSIAATVDPPAERTWHVNGQGLTMIGVPAGQFTMSTGTPYRLKKYREVTFDRGFWLSDREVTVEHFLRFIDDEAYPTLEKPASWKEGYERSQSVKLAIGSPVRSVSWFDAVLYCNWLSVTEGLQPAYARTGETWKWKGSQDEEREALAWQCDAAANGYRLPTEAEWEYACRAVATSTFCFGEDELKVMQYGWIAHNSKKQVWPGGQKLPNAWGLFDVYGNLWEWCDDLYISTIGSQPLGASRVLRGGGIFDTPFQANSAFRDAYDYPDHRSFNQGFRLARTYP